MKLYPEFNDKELEDISEGLRMGSIHTVAPGEADRWFTLSQKIGVIVQMNKSLKA